MTTNRLDIGGSVRAHRLRAPMSGTLMLTYGILIVVCAVTVLPLFWAVSTSLKPLNRVFDLPIQWIPRPPQWANYPAAWNQFPFARYFVNSFESIFQHISKNSF